MKFINWFLIGSACVGIPFFALYHPYDLWPPIAAGIAGGIIFFLFLFVGSIAKHFSPKEKIFFGLAHSIFIVAFVAYSVVFYTTTSFQRENLHSIRSTIGSHIIIEDEIYRRAIVLLRTYYDQPIQGKQRSLVEVFQSLYQQKINNGMFIPNTGIPNFTGPTWTYIQYSGDSLVQFISIDSIGKGLKGDFKGMNGLTGKIQYTALITKRGVSYERNN